MNRILELLTSPLADAVGDATNSFVQAVLGVPVWQLLLAALTVGTFTVRGLNRAARRDALVALVDRYMDPPPARQVRVAVSAAPPRALAKAVRRLVISGPADPGKAVVLLAGALGAADRDRVIEIALDAASPWQRPALRAALGLADHVEDGGP